MKDFSKKPKIDGKALNRIILFSGIIAMVLSVPAVAIFIVIYHLSDNILLSAIFGFAIHFILLLKSERISKFLIRMY